MRTQASAGRHNYLTSTFCHKLTMTAGHPDKECEVLETEFLGRLLAELNQGNIGYWLGQLRKAQTGTIRQVKTKAKK